MQCMCYHVFVLPSISELSLAAFGMRVWFNQSMIEKEMAAIFNKLAHRPRPEIDKTVRRVSNMQGKELLVQPCDQGRHEDR